MIATFEACAMRPASRPRPSEMSIIDVGEACAESHAASARRGVKVRCLPEAKELPSLPVTQRRSPGFAVDRRMGPRCGCGVPISVVVRTKWPREPAGGGGDCEISPPTRGAPKCAAQWFMRSKSMSAVCCEKPGGMQAVAREASGVPPIAAMSETEREMALRAMRSMASCDGESPSRSTCLPSTR